MVDDELDRLILQARDQLPDSSLNLSSSQVWSAIHSQENRRSILPPLAWNSLYEYFLRLNGIQKFALWTLFTLSCLGIGSGAATVASWGQSPENLVHRHQPSPAVSENHVMSDMFMDYVTSIHPGHLSSQRILVEK